MLYTGSLSSIHSRLIPFCFYGLHHYINRQRLHEEWLLREEKAQEEFRAKKKKEEEARKRKEELEVGIKYLVH
jgi:hypothetical protein